MAIITVKIHNTTNRGKYIIGLLKEMAKTGKNIELENVPNKETIKALNDAKQRLGDKADSVEDLFNQLNS